jgi:hypothetical protein
MIFNIKTKGPFRHMKFPFGGLVKGGLTVLISVLIIFTVVKAGTLTPPTGAPAATFYTLSEIYTRLTTNATTSEGGHSFTFSDSATSTHYTLTQIYDIIPTIDPSKLLDDTTYLGIIGNIAIRILSSATTTVSVGYYATTTLNAVDADLAAGNIKSGVNLFGISGDSNVVDTSSGNATAANIATGTIAWVDGVALTGTFDPWSPQRLQTKDDWVNTSGTTNEYIAEETVWSEVSGSPFAGYNSINYVASSTLDLYSGTVKQDTRTGLWWSDAMAVDGGGVATTTSNSFALTADGARPTGGNAIGFCDALNTANFGGYNNWYLPTQKQLLQAYIDGSANNLPNADYAFWSATEYYNVVSTAWRVSLSFAANGFSTKVTFNYVRCVCNP